MSRGSIGRSHVRPRRHHRITGPTARASSAQGTALGSGGSRKAMRPEGLR
jgi:hypothetical protein